MCRGCHQVASPRTVNCSTRQRPMVWNCLFLCSVPDIILRCEAWSWRYCCASSELNHVNRYSWARKKGSMSWWRRTSSSLIQIISPIVSSNLLFPFYTYLLQCYWLYFTYCSFEAKVEHNMAIRSVTLWFYEAIIIIYLQLQLFYNFSYIVSCSFSQNLMYHETVCKC